MPLVDMVTHTIIETYKLKVKTNVMWWNSFKYWLPTRGMPKMQNKVTHNTSKFFYSGACYFIENKNLIQDNLSSLTTMQWQPYMWFFLVVQNHLFTKTNSNPETKSQKKKSIIIRSTSLQQLISKSTKPLPNITTFKPQIRRRWSVL